MITQLQNFYEAIITRNWTATTGDFNVSVAPAISSGYIVISPSDKVRREIIKFTATGTNAYGPFITISNIAHRGLGGTTAQTHTIGEKVRMNVTAQHWDELIASAVAPTVNVGNVTGGTTASVTNSGTNVNAIFDFVLPKGDKGDTGAAAEVVTSFGSPTSDLKVASEKLTKDSLDAKQAIMTKATQSDVATGTDDTKYTTPLAVAPYANNSLYRQAIINGNFDVWQRGTSFTTADVYTADRWYYNRFGSSGNTATISRGEFPDDGTGFGSTYYLKLLTTNTSSGNHQFIYSIATEDCKKLQGKNVTLSFRYRIPTSFTGLTTLNIRSSTLENTKITDLSGTSVVSNIQIPNSTSFASFTRTFTVPSNCKTLSISFGIFDNIVNGAELNLSQVQLNAGDVALPFQPKSFEEELRACQRYYEKSFNYGVAPVDNAGTSGSMNTIAQVVTSYLPIGNVFYKTTKRYNATPVLYNPSAVSTDKIRNVNASTNHPALIQNIGESGFFVHINNSTSVLGNIYCFNWSVDAEL